MPKADKTVVIVQARMTSTRLPGKVLMPLSGKTILEHVIERCQRIRGIDEVCVALPDDEAQEPLAGFVRKLSGVSLFQGAETNVLERTFQAARHVNADTLLRVTSDCPFIDPLVSGALLAAYREAGTSYARLPMDRGYPLGFDTEVLSMSLLQEVYEAETDDYEKEHVTPYIWRRPEKYGCLMLDCLPDLRSWRLVVDEQKDYEFASRVFGELYPRRPNFGFEDLKRLFSEKPELLEINATVAQNPYVK
ncbi:glycosyltransferase family protein [Emcibacter sp.]|uniref:glycosyltransferase family protein n=1 Tax=Emcibacter sp. TaxID=1979954 RepID=UPI002AA670DA|nr:glycosyltransferase family protein [Emcibacter sp.]